MNTILSPIKANFKAGWSLIEANVSDVISSTVTGLKYIKAKVIHNCILPFNGECDLHVFFTFSCSSPSVVCNANRNHSLKLKHGKLRNKLRL